MGTLIAYGIMFAVIAGGLAGLHHKVFAAGAASTCTRLSASAEPQQPSGFFSFAALDFFRSGPHCLTQPELESLVAERDRARREAGDRAAELTSLKSATGQQSAGVLAAKAEADRAKENAKVLLAKLEAANKEKLAWQSKYQAIVSAPKGDGDTCPAACALMRDLERRRVAP